MSRIPDHFIQELLARIDIVEVIGSRVELKRAGREYKGLSPFTNEKSPSFFVNPAKQMFFDFSSGKSGTAITFLMENDRLSFLEAVEELANRAGLEIPREASRGPDRLVLEGPLDALAAADRFFRAQLREHPQAVEYLKKRGVDGETAKAFGIGYAPDGWDALSKQFREPAHALAAGLLKFKDEDASRSGRPYDVFRNRIMFPIRDTRGRTIGFGGRTLANDPAKYLNSPETVVFHKGRNLFGLYEAKQATKSALTALFVVEGYMDVVMLAQHGITNAVATLGTATTREHLGLLFKNTARVVFCFDGDRAGRSAAWRALEQALSEVFEGRECRFMFLPDGHDPDTLVQAEGRDAFLARADAALTLSQFLLAELAKDVQLASLDGRARLAALARPHLEKMREGALKTLIVDELGRMTKLGRADILAMLSGTAAAPASRSGSPASGGIRAVAPGARPVRRALQLLLEQPALAQTVEHVGQLATAAQPGIDILVDAIEFFRENPTSTASQLIELWRDTPQGAALSRVAATRLDGDVELDEAGVASEFAGSIALLLGKALHERAEKLRNLSQERPLAPAELQEWQDIARQLSASGPV